MIRFKLSCENKHEFEVWFRDAADYDKQSVNGLLVCPLCESKNIQKALMSPAVSKSLRNDGGEKNSSQKKPNETNELVLDTSDPRKERFITVLREFKKEMTKHADNVGTKFAEEARKMHYGESKKRGIYGKATEAEAKDLHEEGIDFYAMPRLPEENN